MKAIKVCLLVASASASASTINERMRLRGVETIANESQRRVQEKGEKKSVAKESTVKEIANEIQELDDKIIKEEEKLVDEKGVKEHLKVLKHTKKEKGEKDVVDELTSDLKTIDIVIKADEKQLKKISMSRKS
jgi:CHAT domain-containing protein